MRKCKKCGCYLPDLFTQCLACGYENNSDFLNEPKSMVVTVLSSKYKEYIGYYSDLLCHNLNLCEDSLFFAIDTRKGYIYKSGQWREVQNE